jgi:phosphatidylglycerophosphate synthase
MSSDEPPVRPEDPSMDQIRAVCQPPEVRNRRSAEHWTADVYLRDLSPYLTQQLLKTSISPNGVTVVMIATGASAGLALLIPGLAGGFLAAILGQLQMLWDCCDGEVARWRRQTSTAGVFLDKIGHYTAEGLIPICLGLRAAGWPGEGELVSSWTIVGLLLSVLVLYNKALNDMVSASRLDSGLAQLPDSTEASAPGTSGLRSARNLVRYLPFQRAYHSVEMTLLAMLAAIGDAFAGDLVFTRILLVSLTVFAVPSILGHMAAILSSKRLR